MRKLLVCFCGVAALVSACTKTAPPALPPPSASAVFSAAPAAPLAPGLTSADLDAQLAAAWQKEGVTAAPLASDETFVRRASLDLVGIIPTEDEITRFLADKAPDKRARLIASLLQSPRATEALVNYWENILLPPVAKERRVSRPDFRAFLRDRFSKNVGWDRVTHELVTATGQNGGEPLLGEEVNGAVSYLLKFQGQPADLAGSVSKTFLGVQIQCAQCHDHKTESWKQKDFQQFAACFTEVKAEVMDKGGGLQRTVVTNKEKLPPKLLKTTPPTALDGTKIEGEGARRVALAKWMTSAENPYFAKALVNRVWAHLLGRGFVNPVDDIRPSNPAVAPELWDALAKDFVAHGYDLRRLLAQIAGTRAYQQESEIRGAGSEAKLWSRFRLQPMGPDELLDSTIRALGIEAVVEKAEGQSESELRQALKDKLAFVFDIDEEDDPPDYEGTLSQSLFLLNGRLVNAVSMDLPGSALDKLLAEEKDDEKALRRIFLRTLGRQPRDSELGPLLAHVRGEAPAAKRAGDVAREEKRQAAKKPRKKAGKDPFTQLSGTPSKDPRRRAFEDVTVALVNSSEFFFNH